MWPPTGIALAAFLLFGRGIWPAILVGAFVVNITTAGSVATSLAIAVGNTLEGLAGAYLAERFAHGRRFAERASDIFTFVLLAGLGAPVVSATIGVTTLALAGYASWNAYGSIWLTWWLGDAAGAVILTPALVLWATKPRVRPDVRTIAEACALGALLLAAGVVVFGGGVFGVPVRNYPLTFITIPPLMWAAFRFGSHGAAAATLGFSALAVWGTLHAYGPFVLATQNQSLVVLQAFMATIAVMTFAIAAVAVSERRARDEAQAANRAKDEFLAILSHELRTPLNAVLGWASMLRSGELDPPTAKKALATIERNAQLQAQLVEDLLDISRIVLGQLSLMPERVDFSMITSAAIESVRPAADAKRLRLIADLAPGVAVRGEAARLSQVLANLLSNAVKFTPAGERITITLARHGSRVRLSVTDTGKGITAAFLPQLFDRFSQAERGSRRTHGGLGIGLAIVRHLVELHGGTVQAHSLGEGKGSTFVVELPAA